MNIIETGNRDELMRELRSECEFFMEYMGDIVEQLIRGEFGLRTFDRLYENIYRKAEEVSKGIDTAYERGDFGRPGIMDGGPEYILGFYDDRQRCLDILMEKGISIGTY